MTRRVKAIDRLCRVIVVLSEADAPLKNGQVRDELMARYDMDLAPSTVWRDLQALAEHGLAKRPSSTVRGWVLKINTPKDTK